MTTLDRGVKAGRSLDGTMFSKLEAEHQWTLVLLGAVLTELSDLKDQLSDADDNFNPVQEPPPP